MDFFSITVFWIVFGLLITIFLMLDLFYEKLYNIFKKQKKLFEPSLKSAAIRTSIWISLALIFAGMIYVYQGSNQALLFLTGYTLEESLSVDNIMVFVLIFTSLQIQQKYQHKVLMWGIIGAIIMRILFILAGVTLLESIDWVAYVLGGILLFASYRMFSQRKPNLKFEPKNSLVVRILGKFIPIDYTQINSKFLKKIDGRLYATPLLVALVTMETSDLAFAVDSIPAVLAITTDSFIVITSNVFAILGLRSMYLLVGGGMQKLRYLKEGLMVLLAFIGIKILISDFVEIPILVSLTIIFIILGTTFTISLLKARISKL